jgi:hypothetical protein
METAVFNYQQDRGWSIPTFPQLDSENTLVLAFGSRDGLADGAFLENLSKAYPTAHFLGCSTAGEVCGTSIMDGSMTVAVSLFNSTRLRSSIAQIQSSKESFAVGNRLAHELFAPDLRGIFVLSDGMRVNGSELVSGLNQALPPGTVVTGGLAGDGDRFQKTWVLCQRQRAEGYVSAIGFYGDRIKIGHGSKGGWDVFGIEREVTRSEGNVLFEIDGRSALSLYKDYLGELAAGLPANALLFPLSLRRSKNDNAGLVRTILSIDEKTQSMTFAGDIPLGSHVRFMRANFDRLVDGAMEAGQLAGKSSSEECLAIAISCVGRRLVLRERAEEEIEAVRDSLPASAHLIGFYSYGELSPFAGGPCELHNQTMTLTTLSET